MAEADPAANPIQVRPCCGASSAASLARVGAPFPDASVQPLLVASLAAMALLLGMAPTLAQVQTFTLKRGSNVGPSTKIVPTNCVTSKTDGSVTCDTKVENPPGDTPAKPSYNTFKN